MVLLLALPGALELWELAVVAVPLCDPLVALFSADLFLHLCRLTGPRGCQAAMLPSAVGRHQTPFPALSVTSAGTAAVNRDQIRSYGEMAGQLLSYQDCQEQICKTSCKESFPKHRLQTSGRTGTKLGLCPNTKYPSQVCFVLCMHHFQEGEWKGLRHASLPVRKLFPMALLVALSGMWTEMGGTMQWLLGVQEFCWYCQHLSSTNYC